MQCPLSVEQPTQESSIINQHLATDQKSQQKSVKTITSSPMLRQITHPTLCPQSTAVQGCPVIAFWPWVCWHGAAVVEQTHQGRVPPVAALLGFCCCCYGWIKGGVCARLHSSYKINSLTFWRVLFNILFSLMMSSSCLLSTGLMKWSST